MRTGYPDRIEIDAGDEVSALKFTANGEYLVSSGMNSLQVWRAKEGKRVATMQTKSMVWSIAASKDGKYIAAGLDGRVALWDATTYKRVFAGEVLSLHVGRPLPVFDVDFSPDSTRLLYTAGAACTAIIQDIAQQKQERVETPSHIGLVFAAKYSPQGDRIATADDESVQICDSNNLRLLVNVKVGLERQCQLLWSGSHLFVTAKDREIVEIDASTGSTISDWSVPETPQPRPIALPQHGRFIAYATQDSITFWDASTPLGLILRSSKRRSIAFSPDGRLSFVLQERKIAIKTLFIIKDLEIQIDGTALTAWKNAQFTNAEALLTAAIPTSTDTVHHVLASRALIRARLRQWDAALVDAEESIKIRSSVVGNIAMCVALVGKGETRAGCQVCDTASLHFHPDDVGSLLLIKPVVLFMAGEHENAISLVDALTTTVDSHSTLYVVQAYMHVLLGNLYLEDGDRKRAIESFEHARVKLGNHKGRLPLIISLVSGWNFDDLAITIQQGFCEALLVAGRTKEAGESILRVLYREALLSESTKTWVVYFIKRCLSVPIRNESATVIPKNVPHHMMQLLQVWARFELAAGSWKDALAAASSFVLPRFTIYQALCERLEMTNHVADAGLCFCQMSSELAQQVDGESTNWMRDFKSLCRDRLEDLGDSSMRVRQYDEAILKYIIALSLNPTPSQDLLAKRSKAYAGKGEWEHALNDANELIKLDPHLPLGYERKHEALRGIGRHDDAMDTFEVMLSRMSESSNPDIRELSCRYIWPSKIKETIRAAINDTLRDSPPVLINTVSGRLCEKSEQATAFERTATFTEFISSLTTHSRVDQEVGKYFRYATFSHKWEDDEPLFEKVIRVVVYDLEASPTHEKLQMFCKIVREAGFNWAWSDTCCIDKGDHFVLQEALVSMFKWYEHSAMTLIFLRGVDRLAKRGALTRSIWNMRAWTLQEYHASKVVRIYTEDWTPYLGLEIYNHKDSPEIISEMEEATGISAQALRALCPGLDSIREKLRLASTRKTTREEDAAYSLLGVFSLSLPITYGEGDKALGRLLAQILTNSGDVTSILAWTGKSGSFNACLPSHITVFSELPTSHLPPAVSDADMKTITAEIRSLDFTSLSKLYDQMYELPAPFFVERRLKLPCLAFKLGQVLASQNASNECVFRAQTNTLGVVEIKTREDLSQLGSLCLVHPWIDVLLDRQPVGNVIAPIIEENTDRSSVLGESPSSPGPYDATLTTRQSRAARLMSRIGLTFGGRSTLRTPSLMPPSTLSPTERRSRVIQFIARLRQPFGALLLTATRRNANEYRQSLRKV